MPRLKTIQILYLLSKKTADVEAHIDPNFNSNDPNLSPILCAITALVLLNMIDRVYKVSGELG